MASESHPCLTTLFLSPPNLTTVILSSLPSPNVDHVYHKYWSSPNASTTVTSTKKSTSPTPSWRSMPAGYILQESHSTLYWTLGILDDWFFTPNAPNRLAYSNRQTKRRPQQWTVIQKVLSTLKQLENAFCTDVESTAQYYEYADHRPREPWTWTDEQRAAELISSSVSGTYHYGCLMLYTQSPCLLRWRANCVNASTNDAYPSSHLRLTEGP